MGGVENRRRMKLGSGRGLQKILMLLLKRISFINLLLLVGTSFFVYDFFSWVNYFSSFWIFIGV